MTLHGRTLSCSRSAPSSASHPGCAGDTAPSAPVDRARAHESHQQAPGGHGWVQTRVFSPSAEDVKLGSGPAASICKHAVNDPIFPSICSPSTCQFGGAVAGCSNGEGWEQQPVWVLDPALTAFNSHQLSSDNAGSFKSVTMEVPVLCRAAFQVTDAIGRPDSASVTLLRASHRGWSERGSSRHAQELLQNPRACLQGTRGRVPCFPPAMHPEGRCLWKLQFGPCWNWG